jgi:Uma2 family endonuclease
MEAMPVMLSTPPRAAAPDDPPRKLWTREDCVVLESVGLLEPERYELIEGELIQKVAKDHPHIRSLMLVLEWLVGLFGINFVMPDPSIDVAPEDNPTSEPEPDIIVLAQPFRALSTKPRPEDIRMLVEVAVSTLAFDLNTKAGLYARAGIADYWVLDVRGRRMLVHRDPEEGKYRSIVACSEDELVATLSAPAAQIRVGDLL